MPILTRMHALRHWIAHTQIQAHTYCQHIQTHIRVVIIQVVVRLVNLSNRTDGDGNGQVPYIGHSAVGYQLKLLHFVDLACDHKMNQL